MRIEWPRELRRLRVWSVRNRTLGGGGLDKPFVEKPANRPPLEPGIVKAEPRLAQLGELEQRVLEAAKGATPRDRALEQIASLRVAHTFDEVLHVFVRLARRDRVDRPKPTRLCVGLVLLLEVVAPEHDLAGLRIEPPTVLVRVILERCRKLAESNLVQIEHGHPPLSRSIPPERYAKDKCSARCRMKRW